MRKASFAVLAVAALFIAHQASAENISTEATTTEKGVKTACGKDLKQADGSMGCSKGCNSSGGPGSGSVCVWSCSDGTKGTEKGCKVLIFTQVRTLPTNPAVKLGIGTPGSRRQ
jgi:hypothetical protein